MINNIHIMNNRLSPQLIEHKKATRYDVRNVAELNRIVGS